MADRGPTGEGILGLLCQRDGELNRTVTGRESLA